MSIIKEAKRVKFGQSLTGFSAQATNAINQLKGIKTNLTNMKTAMHSSVDFTSDDETEVDTIIAGIDAAINGIIKG